MQVFINKTVIDFSRHCAEAPNRFITSLMLLNGLEIMLLHTNLVSAVTQRLVLQHAHHSDDPDSGVDHGATHANVLQPGQHLQSQILWLIYCLSRGCKVVRTLHSPPYPSRSRSCFSAHSWLHISTAHLAQFSGLDA